VVGLAVLLAPLVALVLVPGARLGALAAGRKNATGGVASLSSVVPPAPGGAVSFAEIYYAGDSEEYARNLGIVEGSTATLTGFVSGEARGGFLLTRFYVSCCAADAIPYSVVVRPPEGQDVVEDRWLRVSGRLHQEPAGFVLVAKKVERVPEPDDPYLY
jgi:uncharacterized repeat protein (TIGR03943 family)